MKASDPSHEVLPLSSISKTDKADSIGLIAGGGQFPIMVAKAAKSRGLSVVAVAHLDETDPSLEDHVDKIVWIRLGQFGQLIKTFQKNDISKALMAGSISKKRMFDNIRPDLKGLSFISKIAVFHDDNILAAFARELAKEGIEIVSSTAHLPELLATVGCFTRKRPTKDQRTDVDVGWRVAKELGRLDIGQCVVVKKRTVLALEAIEGTNETIKRGGTIAKGGAVVVKVSKPQQDLRFDVPSVGLETINVMSQVRAKVLAVEAGKTLMFNLSEMTALADREGICILAL
ncbi:conserved hypothetical protein [uncultured Desulfobacterium sp.]|uniref:DUF1009 domain-containing protein n=1 Tax=uncultured Desulfobacterium sp. TaxID=201089 RepID=A0A445N031_9BACT|nr:conserved hypothetical protein [uncultured Desulfobacterium sp.]